MNSKYMNLSVKASSIVLMAGLALASCQPYDPATPQLSNQSSANARLSAGKDYVDGELLVQFKEGVSDETRQKAFDKVKGIPAEKILTKAMERAGKRDGVLVLKVNKNVLEAIADLESAEGVEFAEPNFIYTHAATSNDPSFTNGSLWGMDARNAFGSQASTAWAAGKTGSSTVYVGIIDEGYMYTHEDLAANAGTNPGETAGNNKDDDGNGYIDDVYGWDFANNNNSVFDGVNDDHGTHVAGTIGGVGGNGKGVAGVNWSVKMLSAKFLGQNGGTTANAIKAVDYITDLKTRHNLTIPATNNSWGGGGFSQGLQDAITRAGNAGILFVAAAGNDGLNTETSTSYPSGYPNDNIIAVASITSTGALSSFSNYASTKVDLGAPGSTIYSTLPVTSKGKVVSGYGSYSGTSMATPHVSGAVALYASTHAGASASAIKTAIINSVVPTSSLAGKCSSGGRLNVSGF
ncbi:S8 family peptidase [Spirosoma rigui]|uniref:S8 family peptidase n=1 Tax=Spirosoma rigui TaxID=564064 RepID=UPI0009B17C62|nr:S8 family peptidase [Spirosoma rigui]